MKAMRARKQNRARPEGPDEDNTLSRLSGSKLDRLLSSPAHPGAVLPQPGCMFTSDGVQHPG
jgi:hypothetical protein